MSAAEVVSEPGGSNAPMSKEEAKSETLRQGKWRSTAALPTSTDLCLAPLSPVEFYMSDANLPYDKFLFTLSRKEGGWVPIATITTFKRMKPMKAVLSVEEIAQLLRESSKTIEVDESGTKLRRTTQMKPRSDAFQRSVYAKGFPEETETLQQEIEKWFAQFGKIVSVRMRRHDPTSEQSKKFKGSVFAEFESSEEQEKFLALDPTPKFRDDLDMLTMTK